MGMTVFNPSLPPVNSMTTRIVSLAPGLSAPGTAAAVRLKKRGAPKPQPYNPAPNIDDFKKSRRFVLMCMLLDLASEIASAPRVPSLGVLTRLRSPLIQLK